ncbi:hypothetical protein Tco_0038231 [Tanacetum coccineum]
MIVSSLFNEMSPSWANLLWMWWRIFLITKTREPENMGLMFCPLSPSHPSSESEYHSSEIDSLGSDLVSFFSFRKTKKQDFRSRIFMESNPYISYHRMNFSFSFLRDPPLTKEKSHPYSSHRALRLPMLLIIKARC